MILIVETGKDDSLKSKFQMSNDCRGRTIQIGVVGNIQVVSRCSPVKNIIDAVLIVRRLQEIF
jgi:hypothetical protein